MPEEREPVARTENKVGPRIVQAQQCVMRMRLAGMEVPRYYDCKATFLSEGPDETPVDRC